MTTHATKLFRKEGATSHADTVCLTDCSTVCFEDITCVLQPYHKPDGRRWRDGQTASTVCGEDCSGCFELIECGQCCQKRMEATRPTPTWANLRYNARYDSRASLVSGLRLIPGTEVLG